MREELRERAERVEEWTNFSPVESEVLVCIGAGRMTRREIAEELDRPLNQIDVYLYDRIPEKIDRAIRTVEAYARGDMDDPTDFGVETEEESEESGGTVTRFGVEVEESD